MIPLAAERSSLSTACAQTPPTFSLFHSPHVAFGWIRSQCPSWTTRRPTGCWCSSPPATACVPSPALLQLPSDWLAEEWTTWERGTALRSQICGAWGDRRPGFPSGRHCGATMSKGGKRADSVSGNFLYRCHCQVIWEEIRDTQVNPVKEEINACLPTEVD